MPNLVKELKVEVGFLWEGGSKSPLPHTMKHRVKSHVYSGVSAKSDPSLNPEINTLHYVLLQSNLSRILMWKWCLVALF